MHPQSENSTGMAFDPMFLADELGQPLLVVLVKGTFDIVPEQSCVRLAAKQTPILHAGEHWGDPESSSYKYEPEVALEKMATDVVLVGHAHAPQQPCTELDVGVQVGPVRKLVKVFGDRLLVKTGGLIGMTAPTPFATMPLIYERAFGGADVRVVDKDRPSFEPRNPMGMGFRHPLKGFDEPVAVPNIEDPERRFRGYGDTPPPAGFGFIAPNWLPRARYAGTYDEAWQKNRMPLLPVDFDRRFFSAASPGLMAPGFLVGNEPVGILNASPGGRLSFSLPGIEAPSCAIELRGKKRFLITTKLDTVIINTDENKLYLLWRASLPLRQGPMDAVAIKVSTNTPMIAALAG